MSKGYTYNNPGNLTPLPNGQKWIGENGTYMADQKSVSFSSMAYGIAAMMRQINTNITKHGTDTIYKLDERWVGHSPDMVRSNAKTIAKYLPGTPSIDSPVLTGEPLQLVALARGIAHTEIPETISDKDWQAGYQEYLRQNDMLSETMPPLNLSDTEKTGLWMVVFVVAVTTYILAR